MAHPVEELGQVAAEIRATLAAGGAEDARLLRRLIEHRQRHREELSALSQRAEQLAAAAKSKAGAALTAPARSLA